MTIIEALHASAQQSNAAARRAGWIPQHPFGNAPKLTGQHGRGRPRVCETTNAEIMRLHAQGLKAADIGERIGLSASRVAVRIRMIRAEQQK